MTARWLVVAPLAIALALTCLVTAQRRIDALRAQAIRERKDAVTKPERPAGP